MEFKHSHNSINAWANKFAAGDPKAAEKLFDYFYPAIFKYFKSRVKDNATAEDITQDVFLKLAKSIRLYNTERGNFTAWLWQMAKNVFTDYLRTKARRPEHMASDLELDPDTYESTQNYADADLEKVMTLVKKYSTDDQELFRLRYIAGLPYDEIAKIVQRSANAIAVACHRIREKIKQDIHDQTY